MRAPTLLLVLLLLLPLAASGAILLDQEQPSIATDAAAVIGVGPPSGQRIAQVFTAGRTGLLSYVTIPIICDPRATLVVRIEGVDRDRPSGLVLAGEAISGMQISGADFGGGVYAFRSIHLSNAPMVFAGVRYALVLSADSPGCSVAQSPIGDTYGFGDGYYEIESEGLFWAELGARRDLPFQTFVEIPLPRRRAAGKG
jgi:hypothetical protein